MDVFYKHKSLRTAVLLLMYSAQLVFGVEWFLVLFYCLLRTVILNF